MSGPLQNEPAIEVEPVIPGTELMAAAVDRAKTKLTEAEQRARDLLLETEHFDELGFGKLAANARMVARDVLELAPMVRDERSARRAMQEVRDRCLALVTKRVVTAAEAEAARAA